MRYSSSLGDYMKRQICGVKKYDLVKLKTNSGFMLDNCLINYIDKMSLSFYHVDNIINGDSYNPIKICMNLSDIESILIEDAYNMYMLAGASTLFVKEAFEYFISSEDK